MVKSELIEHIANQQEDFSLKEVELFISSILDSMADSLRQGQRIEIRGFGSFTLRYRASRRAHNPKTGELVYTGAKYTPYFKPGKELRERVNASRFHTKIKEDQDDEDDNY